MIKTVIWAVLAAVLAGALGFFGGVTYQKSQAQSSFAGGFSGQSGGGSNRAQRQGGANGPRGFDRGSVATGTILAADASSITVKTADGGSKKVFISADTRMSSQQTLTAGGLKVGDQVMATGEAATGGITARSITVVPPGSDFRMGGFGGGGPDAPAGGAQGGSQGTAPPTQ